MQYGWCPYKKEILDTETCTQGAHHVNTGVLLPRNYQKLGEKPGMDPSLEAPEGARPCQHLDLGRLASRRVREYMSAV